MRTIISISSSKKSSGSAGIKMIANEKFYSVLNVDGSVNIPKRLRTILELSNGDSLELEIINIWKKKVKLPHKLDLNKEFE